MNIIPSKAAFLFALRECRFALKNFRIFIACLFLGTLIIAGVGSTTANIADSMAQDGRLLLGGDVEISRIQKPLSLKEKKYLSAWGKLSEIATFRTMARANSDSSLVDLKAVDLNYPLYGSLSLKHGEYNAGLLARRNQQWGILLSASLATRLKLVVGDRLTLGTENYQVRGIITRQPDVNIRGFQLAPGAIISLSSLLENSLIQPGSLVRYHNRIKLKQYVKYINLKNNIKKIFPDNGWQIRDSHSGGVGLKNFIRWMGQFMALAGLAALLIGGIGVGNAVRVYLEDKTDSIATYKILGAPGRTILITYLSQIMLIAVGAVAIGLIGGALLPLILANFFYDSLSLTLTGAIYLKPLAVAAYYSLSVALIFTLWPLGKALQMPPSRLFRKTFSASASPLSSYAVIISAVLLALVTTVIYLSEFRKLTVIALVAVAVVFAILLGISALTQFLAKKIPRPKKTIFRIALGNIYRPGNRTTSIIISLGLGLVLFTTLALLESNLLRQIDTKTKTDAPSFFFVDLQKNQVKDFTDFLKNRPGVVRYRMVPNLRGRITRIKSIDADKVSVKPEGRWILRGDKGLTFTEKLPADNKIIAGKWWPAGYDGPPEVSISEQMARSMDLKPGDSLSVNILGRNFTLTIASVRRFSWSSLGINYVLMVDPKTLISAPFTYVATAKVLASDEAGIYQQLNRKFPQISIIRMKEILHSAVTLLGKISKAINIMVVIVIISGILVLAGAIASGHKARVYDSALLKIVGATRWDILKACSIEFILLGGITGIIAILLGSVGAYVMITFLMSISWHLPLYIPVTTVVVSSGATLAFGLISLWRAISLPPSQALRAH